VRLTLFKDLQNGPKLYSCGTQKFFYSTEQLEEQPEPNICEEKAREVGEIWDVMSQTVETKNTIGS
jgi:hypothetical protein